MLLGWAWGIWEVEETLKLFILGVVFSAIFLLEGGFCLLREW